MKIVDLKHVIVDLLDAQPRPSDDVLLLRVRAFLNSRQQRPPGPENLLDELTAVAVETLVSQVRITERTAESIAVDLLTELVHAGKAATHDLFLEINKRIGGECLALGNVDKELAVRLVELRLRQKVDAISALLRTLPQTIPRGDRDVGR